MAHQNTPHSPDNESENIHTPNTYVRSKARVFFVRHGKTKNDTGVSDSAPQSSNAELDNIGKKQIKDVATYLSNAGIGDGNDIILYGNDTVRVCESVQIIIEEVIFKNTLRKKITPRLRTTKKGIEGVKRLKENTAVFTDTIVLMEQVRRWINIHIKGNNTGIILVGHKSNKSGSEQAADNINEAIGISFDEIQTGGIIERDIDEVTGKYIDPKKHPETLFLNRGNYKQILELLEYIPELNEVITKFRKNIQIESGKYPIWELQNDINAYFQKHSEAFSRFLNDKNSPIHLRIFCLANLILQQNHTTIENYYLSFECTMLSHGEKKLLLENINDERIMKILRRLFVCKGKLWGDEESELFKGQTELYTLLKQSRLAYITATGLQSNSLDPLIKAEDENAAINRQLYYEEEDKNPDTQNEQPEKKIVQKDFDPDMFLKGGKYSKFIIRAHVGEGKSIYLSELVKQFSLEQDKEVKFVIAKNLKEEDIKEVFSNDQAIVCIDALDEANEAVRNSIKEEFRKFGGRCIISTRHSESFPPDEKTCILYFRSLDSTKYIDSRFGEDTTKATELKKWIEQHGLSIEVKGNPLLLNLIVLLASANKDDKEWMEKYKIPEYDQIKTKSELYENVVKFVLAKHNKDTKKQKGTNIELGIWMDQLGEYAYRKFSATNSTNTTPITFDDAEYYDIHLSILFKSEENGEYNFIHKSFYEYFLARHLAKMENGKGNQAIYSYRDEKMKGNWNDWREFRPIVIFYGEELVKNGKIDELVNFLGKKGILKNDDIFGENFFMGLEILYKLPESVRGANQIKEILKKNIKIISQLNIEEIIKKFESIKKFINGIGYIDTVISDIVICKLQEIILEYPDNSNHIYENILEIGTPKGIIEVIEYANKSMTGGGYYYTKSIYLRLLKIGNPEGIVGIKKIIKGAIKKREYFFIRSLYEDLIETKNSEAIDEVIRGIRLLNEDIKGARLSTEMDYFDINLIYRQLAKTGNSEAIDEAIRLAELFMDKRMYHCAGDIYIELAKIGNPEGITGVKKCSEFDYGVNIKPYNIILGLVNIGNSEAIDEAIRGVKLLMEDDENYIDARFVYSELVKTGNPEAIDEAIRGAELFMEKGMYTYAGQIHQELIENGYPIKILEAIKCAKLLMEDDICYHYNAISLYRQLAKTGNSEAINEVIKWTKQLITKEDRYRRSFFLYEELAKTGNSEAINEAIRGVRLFMVENNFFHANIIYDALIETGNSEAINETIRGAELFMEKGKYYKAEGIYRKLIKNGYRIKLLEAIKCTMLLMEERDYGRSYKLYVELAKTGNSEAINEAIQLAELFVSKGGYVYIGYIYKELYSLPIYIPPPPSN